MIRNFFNEIGNEFSGMRVTQEASLGRQLGVDSWDVREGGNWDLNLRQLLPRPPILPCLVLVCGFMGKDSCCFSDEGVAARMKKQSGKMRWKVNGVLGRRRPPGKRLCGD